MVLNQSCSSYNQFGCGSLTIWLCTTGRRAVSVAAVPQEGMAVSLNDSSGLIEFTQDQPYVMDRRDDKERIPFHTAEVLL